MIFTLFFYNFNFCAKPYKKISFTHHKRSKRYKLKVLIMPLLYFMGHIFTWGRGGIFT